MVRERVDFPGATYVEHDGEAEILPGVRLLPTPGHTAGHRIVVVETDEGRSSLGGDVGHSFEKLELGDTRGRQLVLELAGADLPHACRGGACPKPRGCCVQSPENRA
jgi:N-acyl homoserine lactone hydrolase